MNYDKTNKDFNIVFFCIYVICIMVYVLLIDFKNDSEIVLKKYAVSKENIDVKETSFTRVEYSNYKYNIPDTIRYEIDKGITIFDNQKWVSNIQIIDCEYDDILKYKDNIKKEITEYNYEISNLKEKIINNHNVFIIEINEYDDIHLLVYTKLDKYKSYSIEIVSLDKNDYEYIIEQIIEIIDTANKVNDNEVIGSL